MLKRSFLVAVAGILLATAPYSYSLAQEADEAEQEAVGAVRIAPSTAWEGQQHVAADNKGRAFILRPRREPNGLLVYPVERQGGLGEPEALEVGLLGEPQGVRDAAMDKHGDWVTLSGGEPRWFPSGEEETLPELHWMADSVELLDGRPIVSVIPFPVGRVSKRELRGSPPLVVQAGRDRWYTLVSSELDEVPEREKYVSTRQRHAGQLYVDPDGDLWFAYRYRYRLEKYSSAGRELLTLEIDDAKIKHREQEEVEDQRVKLEEERARYSRPSQAGITTNTAVRAIINLVEGSDGRLYLLARGAGKAADSLVLDRLDMVQGILERVPLAFSSPGSLSLAAGKDGLYVVPYNGKRPRWMIPWERLEEADWLPVKGVELNGLEVQASRDG